MLFLFCSHRVTQRELCEIFRYRYGFKLQIKTATPPPSKIYKEEVAWQKNTFSVFFKKQSQKSFSQFCQNGLALLMIFLKLLRRVCMIAATGILQKIFLPAVL